MGTEGGDYFSCPRWWVCDGPAPNRGDSGWDGCGLMASGMVLVDDGGGVKKGGKGGVPQGRDLARARSPGAHRPSMRPSPWCLPAASEVAPSCPPPQAPHGHPIPMPASRGTLRVPRSRSSWKRLSSTARSWYVPPQGAGWAPAASLEAALWERSPTRQSALGERGQVSKGTGGGRRDQEVPRARRGWVHLAWAQPVSSACLCLLPCVFICPLTCVAGTLCRAVSQAPALKVKLSRSDPVPGSCLVGRGQEWAGRGGGSSLSLCQSPRG